MTRFICDDHLGKLARLLRSLGFDTLWCRSGRDAEIVEACALDRVFLTRDSAWTLKTLPGPKLILTESEPFGQLRFVLAHYALEVRPGDFLSRCLICNAETAAVTKEEVAALLPPHVRKTRDRFRRCPDCRRIYWEGTHVAAMRARLGKEGIL